MKLVAALLVLALPACSPQPAVKAGTVPDLDPGFRFALLEIVNDAGERIELDVYLAEDDEQQRRGLMFVREMPATTGMLFIYGNDDYRSMWMKNTFISLDMVFARGDGTVSSIVTDTTPRSLRSIGSTEPVRYVLELNSGTARRLGLGPDSRLLWRHDEQE